jgi:ABC-type phosphate transport system ATPase subunit
VQNTNGNVLGLARRVGLLFEHLDVFEKGIADESSVVKKKKKLKRKMKKK